MKIKIFSFLVIFLGSGLTVEAGSIGKMEWAPDRDWFPDGFTPDPVEVTNMTPYLIYATIVRTKGSSTLEKRLTPGQQQLSVVEIAPGNTATLAKPKLSADPRIDRDLWVSLVVSLKATALRSPELMFYPDARKAAEALNEINIKVIGISSDFAHVFSPKNVQDKWSRGSTTRIFDFNQLNNAVRDANAFAKSDTSPSALVMLTQQHGTSAGYAEAQRIREQNARERRQLLQELTKDQGANRLGITSIPVLGKSPTQNLFKDLVNNYEQSLKSYDISQLFFFGGHSLDVWFLYKQGAPLPEYYANLRQQSIPDKWDGERRSAIKYLRAEYKKDLDSNVTFDYKNQKIVSPIPQAATTFEGWFNLRFGSQLPARFK